MHGTHVVGSCSASARQDALVAGVSEVVDYRTFDAASQRGRFDVVFDTAGTFSLRQCGVMLRGGGRSLHIVPTVAKMIGCLLSSRHHLVFANPAPQSLVEIAEAAERGILDPEIGSVVPLSNAIAAISERESTNSLKGKLVVMMLQEP
jgi:NADPH:quinone reductase-like Zn-dependent oxidoreductase